MLRIVGKAAGHREPAVKTSTRIVHVSLTDALTKGPPPPGNLAVPIFSHRSLAVEVYNPVRNDPQKPHTRDEIHFVARHGFKDCGAAMGTQQV
jgi:hypothetical protein